ncbi:hypothetical protein GQ42DRAFT_161213 [Ramicandelaber brevisporus]|nr:hypothetical protein GQ42DRAFT_161213 [Ramicandelaber brevisporus]
MIRAATSVVSRRGLSTLRQLVPPNLGAGVTTAAAPSAVSTTGAAASETARIVDLYKHLPKGPVSAADASIKGSGPFAWYYRKYLEGDKASAAPLLHFILAFGIFGYTVEYHHHLKYHKGTEHH